MVQFRLKTWVTWMAMVVVGATAVAASSQEHAAAPHGPAPVLVTVREIVKPGEEAAHAKLEAEYGAVLDAGKGSEYYLGMGAITGKQEVVFVSGYSSLEEMSDVHDYDETMMGAKLDGLEQEHNATLAGMETTVWKLRPGLSNPDALSLGKMRYMELTQIHVKLGHSAEFTDVMKQVEQGWMKVDPDFHYVVYQQAYGDATDDSYLVLIATKSLGDFDKHHAKVGAYQKSVGAAAHKQMQEFESADYDSTVSNLFVFTPAMSRMPESWTKDDLSFWKPKAVVAAPAKKAATAK